MSIPPTTDDIDDIIGIAKSLCERSMQTDGPQRLALIDFINDDEGLHHYRGMQHYDRLMLVYQCLGKVVHQLKYYNGHVHSIITTN